MKVETLYFTSLLYEKSKMSSFLRIDEEYKIGFYFGIFSQKDLNFIKSVVNYFLKKNLAKNYPRIENLCRLARVIKIYDSIKDPNNKRHDKFRYV